jgi:hypothetical protein
MRVLPAQEGQTTFGEADLRCLGGSGVWAWAVPFWRARVVSMWTPFPGCDKRVKQGRRPSALASGAGIGLLCIQANGGWRDHTEIGHTRSDTRAPTAAEGVREEWA